MHVFSKCPLGGRPFPILRIWVKGLPDTRVLREGWLNIGPGPLWTPFQSFQFSGLGWGLRLCISKKLQVLLVPLVGELRAPRNTSSQTLGRRRWSSCYTISSNCDKDSREGQCGDRGWPGEGNAASCSWLEIASGTKADSNCELRSRMEGLQRSHSSSRCYQSSLLRCLYSRGERRHMQNKKKAEFRPKWKTKR